ncbi:uncharacterized protein dikar isoform X2 [Lepeophtheirus salmonis]|uniref:uncharacterized protein dikar isoform X2 n=1 Tax=Lepeophtheirus salmonis TaxID=72036 RepID=UPI001AE4FDD2|nr:DNA ligase 1-like isoform X2 [Lepeophtheirus salmonis]
MYILYDNYNYNKYLRRLFISKAEEAEEDEVDYDFECEEFIERSVNFENCSLRNRVTILHQLCEFRLDGEDVSDKVKNLEASSLRVEPLGKDSEGFTYWYFYGTRLYKEASTTTAPSSLSLKSPSSSEDKKRRKEKDKKKRKKKEKKKKKKKNSHSSSDDDNYADSTPSPPTWSVACLTLQDWIDLTNKMRHSKKKHDKDLYITLSDNFLPEIIKMFADKEREERRRLQLLAPKRMSSRIERKRAEQEEKDRVLAEKYEDDQQLDEDYDEKILEDCGKRRSRRLNEDNAVERNRSERMRQREQMKELREKKIAEKEVAKTFPREVETQKMNLEIKKDEPLSPQIEGEDDLSDVSLQSSPIIKKTQKTSSKRNNIFDDNVKHKKIKVEEEEVIKDEEKLDVKNSNDTTTSPKKLSRKSSPVKKRESLKRKKRLPKSSVRPSKRHKWKSDSSSNEDNDNDDDHDYKEEDELEDDMISASSEEPHHSESSAGEEQQIKEVIKQEEENEAADETSESPKVSKTSSFANALLKVGTKSTRDSNLDKTIRKSPGRLLQTAGLQKSGTLSSSSSKVLNGDRLNGGIGINVVKNHDNNGEEDLDEDEEPKISFSLYGGHLPVDIGGFSKSPSGDSSPAENRLSGLSSSSSGISLKKKDEPESPVRKVFSNWGGEFFKKNLDYRANTNKILEKMNLTTGSGGGVGPSGPGSGPPPGSGGSSVNSSSNPSRKDFLSPFKKTINNQTSNNTPPGSEEKKPPSIKPLGFS